MARTKKRSIGTEDKLEAYLGIGTCAGMMFCVAALGAQCVLVLSILAALSWMAVSFYTLRKMLRLRSEMLREGEVRVCTNMIRKDTLTRLLRDQTVLSIIIISGFVTVVCGYMCLARKGMQQDELCWVIGIALFPLFVYLLGYGSAADLRYRADEEQTAE